MFCIICDAQEGRDDCINTLVLVDRKLSEDLWWTPDDPSIIMRFKSKTVAEKTCSRFKHNNPRVVVEEEADALLDIQVDNIIMSRGATNNDTQVMDG